MSSSSSQQRNKELLSMAPAAETAKVPPRRRMTQEQIDNLIRYETVRMPEDAIHRLGSKTRELLTPAELAYQGSLPVPMGQLEDYVANIFREVNESEAWFMRERSRILDDYYTNGYAEEEVVEEEAAAADEAASSPPVPVSMLVANRSLAPGRRRFRPGVTKSKQAGKPNKMALV